MIVEKEYKEVLEKGTGRMFYSSKMSSDENMEIWRKREDYRKSISWHIPNEDLIDCLFKNSPIISVGSGYGYSESIANQKGCDIICTDISNGSDNKWCHEGIKRMEIIKMEASEAIQNHSERNVFMAWPPYDNPMAYEVVKKMCVGRILIYVGEGYGGCTGDDNFFEYVSKNFEEIEQITIDSWSGIYDNCTVYKKISHGEK